MDEDDIDINARLHDNVSTPAHRVARAIDEIGDEAQETAVQLAEMAAAEKLAADKAEALEAQIRDQSIQLREAQKEYDLTSKKIRKLEDDFNNARITTHEYNLESVKLNDQLQKQKNSIRSLSGHLTRYKRQLHEVNTETGRLHTETKRTGNVMHRLFNRIMRPGIGIVNKFTNTLNRINHKPLGSVSAILFTLAFTILPAMIPLGAGLLGQFLGLAVAFAGAGAAAALFGGVAIGAISRLMKEQQKATGPGRALLNQIKELKKTWGEFLDQTENGIFIAVDKVLTTVTDHMLEFVPAVNSVSEVVGILADEFDRWADSGGLKAIADWIDKYGSKFLLDLGRGFGDMAVGIGHVVEALTPLGLLMSGGFAENMEKFKNNTENLGENPKFQRFINYLVEKLPQVKQFFGAVGDAAMNFARVLAPWGDLLLPVITRVFEIFGSLDPLVIAVGFAALGVTLGFVAGGFWGILAAVTGVGILFANLYQRSETFRKMMQDVGAMIDEVWGSIKTQARETWTNTIEPALQGVADKFNNHFIPAWERAWPYIRPVIVGLAKFAGNSQIIGLGAVIKGIAWALGTMIDQISSNIHIVMELADILEDVATWANDAKDAIANLGESITGIDSGKLGDIMSFAGAGIPLIGGLFFAGGEPGMGTTGVVGEVGPEAFIGKDGSIDILGKNGPELTRFSKPGAVVPASATADPFGGNTGNAPDWAMDVLRAHSAGVSGDLGAVVVPEPREPVERHYHVRFGDIIANGEMDIEAAVKRGIQKAEEEELERR